LKGIILAGGKGTRLYPATIGISKQLLPVYNKPMVYYPLTTLMMAGINDVLVITTNEDTENYRRVLGFGEDWGMSIRYAVQHEPKGLAEAFIIGRHFLQDDPCSALVLGDNVFFGHELSKVISEAARAVKENRCSAAIFGYPVRDPERYGVVELSESGRAKSIEEKPKEPKSRLAVPGLYFYNRQVLEIVQKLKPSPRGELEITDVNREYMKRDELCVFQLGRGTAWLDAGTHESLLQASNFIQAVEERQGLLVGSPEEVAYRMGFIDRDQFRKVIGRYSGSYRDCLDRVAQEA
jgi:glucose-1-phosphate thymidylyltransferase